MDSGSQGTVTTLQIISLVVAGCVAAYFYLPSLTHYIPAKQPKNKLLDHLEDLVKIRSAYQTPEITASVNALIEVLLKVK